MGAPGSFVVFEGVDGTGKSTQSVRLADHLGALWTRQPGGTPLGGALRAILLEGTAGELSDRAEALLMAADRAQHVAEVIRPALAAGRHVVCDRYIGSSVAYQGWGRGLDPDRVAAISDWAVEGLRPDLVVLLDLPVDEALARAGTERHDRIEAAGAAFLTRVREGYLAQAAADPRRWVVVDAAGSVDDVAGRVDREVRARLGP